MTADANYLDWLLDDLHLILQADLLGQAAGSDREALIRALLERDRRGLGLARGE